MCAVNTCFAIMLASKGIKEYGMKAVAAMIKELTQLDQGAVPEHNKPVCIPIDPSTLTKQELDQALGAVNLIKKKCDNTMKGRTCANGSKQHIKIHFLHF